MLLLKVSVKTQCQTRSQPLSLTFVKAQVLEQPLPVFIAAASIDRSHQRLERGKVLDKGISNWRRNSGNLTEHPVPAIQRVFAALDFGVGWESETAVLSSSGGGEAICDAVPGVFGNDPSHFQDEIHQLDQSLRFGGRRGKVDFDAEIDGFQKEFVFQVSGGFGDSLLF